MAIYLGKNVVLAFCADYSASIDGRLVVYEAQHLLSDNYDSPNSRLNAFGERSASGALIAGAASSIWESYFRKITSDQFIVDFPIGLEADKALQRKHLFTNCSSISPDFLLCNAATPEDDIAHLMSKYHNRVVLKGKGGIGYGNKFLREHPVDHHQDLIESYKKVYGHFVIEQEVMYSPAGTEASTRGVCYRDVVFYDTETNQLRFFEVYAIILDAAQSTNSHSDPNTISEKCFFLTHTPPELKSLMQANEKKFPALYDAKKRAFTTLSNQILHYLQTEVFSRNLLSDPLLILFINKFHNDDKEAYQVYLKLGRFLDTKNQSDQTLTDKLDGNLKSLFVALTAFFTNKKKSISEQKKEGLRLIALKLSTLNRQDLWIFQHLLLSLREAPGPSSLRELWHQKNPFSFCCCAGDPYANTRYGNTTAGNRYVEMISHARAEAKNVPQFTYVPPSTQELL